ncbi:uncharacterized protein TNCV_1867351 [Trichonephila clavipes]|nr:uncharacterized protein TNCV_1867351 [Trichonephila clavipes]
MTTPGFSFTPTLIGHEENVGVGQTPRVNALQWCPARFNFPNLEAGGAAGLRVLPEVCFSGSENVEDFLERVDNNIKFFEILRDLACAYLKGHLLGRERDCFHMFGSTLVQNTATDFEQLKKRH